MKAVDHFMRTNKRIYNTDNNYDLSSLYRAIDADEYDILYGIDDSDFYGKIRNAAYKKMYGNKLTIIYECPCKTTKKENHHYNYNRPLEVARLCRSCHLKEHSRLRLLAVSTADNSTTPAVQTSVEDRGELSNQSMRPKPATGSLCRAWVMIGEPIRLRRC